MIRRHSASIRIKQTSLHVHHVQIGEYGNALKRAHSVETREEDKFSLSHRLRNETASRGNTLSNWELLRNSATK
jgi:hypothetical protein